MDIKKVIKGLECCLIYGDGCNKCTGCPYLQEVDCVRQNKRDVLATLKEQDAEIRQLRLALDIAKGTCKGIIMEGQ